MHQVGRVIAPALSMGCCGCTCLRHVCDIITMLVSILRKNKYDVGSSCLKFDDVRIAAVAVDGTWWKEEVKACFETSTLDEGIDCGFALCEGRNDG